MVVGYKHNDERSKIIRNMDHCVAHDFLCHNDNHDDCDGGVDCSADPHRLECYNKAFEESDPESAPISERLPCGCDTHQFGCLSRPYDPSDNIA